MKQITLEPRAAAIRPGEACVSGLAARWVLYSLAMALLWQVAGPSPQAHIVVWLIAAFVGLRLLRAT
jgi:hypothetical protein